MPEFTEGANDVKPAVLRRIAKHLDAAITEIDDCSLWGVFGLDPDDFMEPFVDQVENNYISSEER